MADDTSEIRVVISGVATQLRQAISGAKDDISGLGAAIKAVPDQIKVAVSADTTVAGERIKALSSAVKDVQRQIDIEASADTGVAEAKLKLLQREIKATQDAAARGELGGLLSGGGGGDRRNGGGGGADANIFRGLLPGGQAANPLGIAAAGLIGAPLIGSAGAGVLGAGALGLGALGTFATGLGSILPVITQTAAGITEVSTAMDALNKAQGQYGAGSREAAQAQQNLNFAMADAGPQATAVAKALQSNSNVWSNVSTGADNALNRIILPGLKVVAGLMPTVAGIAKQSLDSIGKGLQPVFDWLSSGSFKDVLTQLGDAFSQLAPALIQGIASVLKGLLNVAVASAPYVVQIAQAFERWSAGLASSLSPGQHLTSLIGGLVGQTRSWWNLAVALGKLLFELFSNSASQGQGLVNQLTEIVDRWDKWLNTTAGQQALHNFFSQIAAVARDLVSGLGTLVPMLAQIVGGLAPLSQLLRPVEQLIGTIAGWANDLSKSLPPVLNALPGLAVAATVLGSWKALQSIVASTMASILGAGGAEAAGGAATATLAGGAVAARTLASAEAVQAAAAGAGGLTLAGAATSGAGTLAAVAAPVLAAILAITTGGPSKGTTGTGLASLLGPVGATHDTGSVFSNPLGNLGGLLNPFGGSGFLGLGAPTTGNQSAQVTQALKSLQSELKGVTDPAQVAQDKLGTLREQIQKLSEMPDLTVAQRQGLAKLAVAFDPVTLGLERAKQQWSSTFAGINATTGNVMAQVLSVLKTDVQNINANLGSGTRQGAMAMAATITSAYQTVLNNTSLTAKGVQSGLRDIAEQLNKALRAVGAEGKGTSVSLAQFNAAPANVQAGLLSGQLNTVALAPPNMHYTGGKVTQPGYFAGEEAPQHPEYILATNPAYRQRNLGLWAAAGGALGVPGFATGGVSQKGSGNVAGGGSGAMGAMISMANQINAHHYPYLWGGGHNSSFSGPYDCSGAVSAVLHAGGFLSSPEVSGQMMSFGQAGPGRVTLYANPTHVYMSLDGRFFGTSGANPGGGAGWFAGAPRPGFVVRHINPGGAPGFAGTSGLGGISAPRIGTAGAVGAVGQAVLNTVAQAASARLASAGGGGAGGGFGGGNLNENLANQSLGRSMMIAAGFSGAQWPALRSLWARESGWDPNAVNASSGAYGIPQALGHGHPFSLGDARAQIAWGLSYIKSRYGNPAAAWQHEEGFGWYAKGGVFRGAGVPRFAAGGSFTSDAARGISPVHAYVPRPINQRPGQRPPKAATVRHPTTPKIHVPAPISDATKRLLPADVVGLDTIAARYAAQQVSLSDADQQLTYEQGLPPFPAQALVTLSDADVAFMDPTGSAGLQQGDQLVNQSGMIVGRFFGPSGIAGGSWVPGIEQRRTQIGAQLENLDGQQSAIVSAGSFYDQAIKRELKARQQRAERRARVLAFLRKQVVHAKAIQAELAAATTGNLKANLGKALSRQAINKRLSSLRSDKLDVSQELAAEKRSQAQMIPIERDPTHTQALQSQLDQINQSISVEQQLSTGGAASAAVQAARSALHRNDLKKRLAAYAKVDTELGGRPYDVGTTGIIGQLLKEMDALDANRNTETSNKTGLAPALQQIKNAIASYVYEEGQLGSASPVQVRAPGVGTAQTDQQLLTLVQTQLQTTMQALSLSQANFAVFQNFASSVTGALPGAGAGPAKLVGSFQSGISYVPQTGPALVHRGEIILPDPDGPAANRAAAALGSNNTAPNVTIELTLSRDDQALAKIIDARMNGKALQIVSDHSGQRARLMAGVSRG